MMYMLMGMIGSLMEMSTFGMGIIGGMYGLWGGRCRVGGRLGSKLGMSMCDTGICIASKYYQLSPLTPHTCHQDTNPHKPPHTNNSNKQPNSYNKSQSTQTH